METWHGPDLGRLIAALLERCAELLGVDLATVCELAATVEPYVRADGTRIWSLMLLECQLWPEAYGRQRGATSTADEPDRRHVSAARAARCPSGPQSESPTCIPLANEFGPPTSIALDPGRGEGLAYTDDPGRQR
jgi:hypothetical protein